MSNSWNWTPLSIALATAVVVGAAACGSEPPISIGQVVQAYNQPPDDDDDSPPGDSQPDDYSQTFTLFESGQVRPLALTPNKKLLLATNTPDARLEIYKVKNHGLKHLASVPVGLEPVAVAARNNHEAWVVNHLSDSVSIIKLDGKKSYNKRTLHVGDEPRDIVFAGPNKSRAFITTAHRGQNSPIDPQLTTPSVGRADVWVFDAGNQGTTAMAGTPTTVLTFFSDTPRALAVTPDGSKVYVAAFKSGNGTAATFVGNFVGLGNPLPPFAPSSQLPIDAGVNAFSQEQSLTSVVVKYDGQHWTDETGAIRDAEMTFTLPDRDVFAINANANPPQAITGSNGIYAHVGTVLFNMIVNPATGKVYVSNLESNNQQRFEGENVFAGAVTSPTPSVRGKVAFSRITVLDQQGGVAPRHLNKHIDYSTCCAPIPNLENARSVAFPTGMEITEDGQTLYVASLGTNEVAVYNTGELDNDSFIPDTANQIPVSGGGPTGLAFDEDADRLYVLTRFDNSIKIINTQTKAEIGGVTMHNPEPAHIVNGRRFLYDASISSSHGDSACFSCHIFGDTDHLAWDLGVPDNPNTLDPNSYQNESPRKFFSSMKGLMATQSLRGLDNHGPMHWRGDRTGADIAHPELNVQPNGGGFDEQQAFKAFAGAFASLLGRDTPLADADMQAFTDFALEMMYPPNPIRHLDNSLTPLQQQGFDLYFGRKTFFDPLVDGEPNGAGTLNCNDCHTLDRTANLGLTSKPGFFGSNNLTAEVGGVTPFKNPQLRNLYQKVGKFGMPMSPLWLNGPNFGVNQGEQIRGFGFLHDGSFDRMTNFFFALNFGTGDATSALPPFLGVPINNPDGIPFTPEGFQERDALEAYMMVFDSNFRPVVGQQVTLSKYNAAAAYPRIDLLMDRAEEGECQLIARDSHKNEGFLYNGHVFLRNKHYKSPLSDHALRHRAHHSEITYTCVMNGNGVRLALDRDQDGTLDGNE